MTTNTSSFERIRHDDGSSTVVRKENDVIVSVRVEFPATTQTSK